MLEKIILYFGRRDILVNLCMGKIYQSSVQFIAHIDNFFHQKQRDLGHNLRKMLAKLIFLFKITGSLIKITQIQVQNHKKFGENLGLEIQVGGNINWKFLMLVLCWNIHRLHFFINLGIKIKKGKFQMSYTTSKNEIPLNWSKRTLTHMHTHRHTHEQTTTNSQTATPRFW